VDAPRYAVRGGWHPTPALCLALLPSEGEGTHDDDGEEGGPCSENRTGLHHGRVGEGGGVSQVSDLGIRRGAVGAVDGLISRQLSWS
jgi:hypothetical protein